MFGLLLVRIVTVLGGVCCYAALQTLLFMLPS